jgi:hypothetical protein
MWQLEWNHGTHYGLCYIQIDLPYCFPPNFKGLVCIEYMMPLWWVLVVVWVQFNWILFLGSLCANEWVEGHVNLFTTLMFKLSLLRSKMQQMFRLVLGTCFYTFISPTYEDVQENTQLEKNGWNFKMMRRARWKLESSIFHVNLTNWQRVLLGGGAWEIILKPSYHMSYNKEVIFVNWYKNDLALNVLFACVFYFVQHFHKEDNIFNQHFKKLIIISMHLHKLVICMVA